MGILLQAKQLIKRVISKSRGYYRSSLKELFPKDTQGSRDLQPADYQAKLLAETSRYKDVSNVHDLPKIFHYWSNKHLKPIFEEYGISSFDQFYSTYLLESARRSSSAHPVFISIGAGNLETEVRVARLLREAGLEHFTLECLELNPHMLQRGRDLAVASGVISNLELIEGDFNRWKPNKSYAAVMANHSLHHVLNLEGLFDSIKSSLEPTGYFITSDMIGRNGHQRWPEALEVVHEFWRQMPPEYRYNQLLKRYEELYENWDCSNEGFEGIRAQDILPLLVERFDFKLFIGFSNVIGVFIDRGFGHNFDPDNGWDREFIDKIHIADERGLRSGRLKPTQMIAVMTPVPSESHQYSRGLSPAMSIRKPD